MYSETAADNRLHFNICHCKHEVAFKASLK